MFTNKLLRLALLLLAFTLNGCGGSAGASLGAFPALTKTVGDIAFNLVSPSSDSPGAFTYTSSNTAVATISGISVTIIGAGTTTITATQTASGKWGSASVSAVLTVSPRTCISPAVLVSGVCTAISLPGNFVAYAGHSWMPVSLIGNWADANAFCTQTTINAQTGWRLPNDFELTELSQKFILKDIGWSLGKTWTSKAGVAAATRITQDLNTIKAGEEFETGSAYFTCIK